MFLVNGIAQEVRGRVESDGSKSKGHGASQLAAATVTHVQTVPRVDVKLLNGYPVCLRFGFAVTRHAGERRRLKVGSQRAIGPDGGGFGGTVADQPSERASPGQFDQGGIAHVRRCRLRVISRRRCTAAARAVSEGVPPRRAANHATVCRRSPRRPRVRSSKVVRTRSAMASGSTRSVCAINWETVSRSWRHPPGMSVLKRSNRTARGRGFDPIAGLKHPQSRDHYTRHYVPG